MTQQIPLAEAKRDGCQCGCSHGEQTLELDARTIPHEVRHGAILGSLSQLPSGASLVLAAPHDPLPLLAEVTDMFGDQMAYEYVEHAPDAVRVRFTRAPG